MILRACPFSADGLLVLALLSVFSLLGFQILDVPAALIAVARHGPVSVGFLACTRRTGPFDNGAHVRGFCHVWFGRVFLLLFYLVFFSVLVFDDVSYISKLCKGRR